MVKIASIGLSLVLLTLHAGGVIAEPSEAERNLNEFKGLSLERQRAILHIEASDELFGPMSLFDCAEGCKGDSPPLQGGAKCWRLIDSEL